MTQQTDKILLETMVRTTVGTQAARSTRRRGWVPGVVYKDGGSTVAVEVPQKGLDRALHTKAGENVLITLQFGEGAEALLRGHPWLSGAQSVVLIKEIQRHPVSHHMIHVDFHQISLTQRITVAVPLAFKGEAPGVKMEGGVLEHLRWDLEVECLPTEIPSGIEVDISHLGLGQTLHVKDLVLPTGVRAVIDPEQPLIGCVAPKAEEVPVPSGAVAEQAPEPEVIKQKKPEEAAEAPEEGKGKEKGPKAEKAEAKKG